MRPSPLLFYVLSLAFSTASATETTDNDVFAQRGKGIVTQKSFSARADKIPADARLTTLRNENRLRDVVNALLLSAQLAADAREAGYDKNEIVVERMRLAAQAELGAAWLRYYLESQPAANYEVLAKENYQLNQNQMQSVEKIDVSQILISTEQRSPLEAKELANTVYQTLKTDPMTFDSLVLEYSEDPSAAANKGKFVGVKKGDMVKSFEEVAFTLSTGEISAPVETQYGFHIIRLDAYFPPRTLSFDAVKEKLIRTERKRHEDRIKRDYLGGLTSLETSMTKEALEEMVRRLFGESYMVPTVVGAESE